jgi:23S rRNA pseudouridine2605 synthase
LKQRLQKALAEAGVASRREADAWIGEGRVSVNGVVAVPGTQVAPEDRISVDGRHIRRPQPNAAPAATRVLLYKKRVGEIVTESDPEGRRTVFRKLPKLEQGRWIAVGRLDINTSGLLLFTNNGELASRLMHPRHELPRSYAVRVHGSVDEALCQRLLEGVELEDGFARFDALASIGAPPGEGGSSNQWFEVTVHEGRNRLVRRLWESQDCEVARLIRVGYGPVALGRGIRSAGWREATPEELNALQLAVDLPTRKAARKSPHPRRKPGKAGR